MQVLEQMKAKLSEIPKWRLGAYGALTVLGVGYLIWSFAHKPAPAAGTVMLPPPAVETPKVPGPMLKVPLKIVPPAAVERKFPQLGSVAPGNPVIDTAKIPKAENGGATVTFMNVSTGTATTKFIPAAAPWFALEDRNAVGAAYIWTTQGPAGAVYYRRDIFRIKDFHVGGVVGAVAVGGKVGAGAGILGEVRF